MSDQDQDQNTPPTPAPQQDTSAPADMQSPMDQIVDKVKGAGEKVKDFFTPKLQQGIDTDVHEPDRTGAEARPDQGDRSPRSQNGDLEALISKDGQAHPQQIISDHVNRTERDPPGKLQDDLKRAGGPDDPTALYRALASQPDAVSKYRFMNGVASLADHGNTIATTLASGTDQHPPDPQGAVNAWNEALKHTPDGNNTQATLAGDKVIVNNQKLGNDPTTGQPYKNETYALSPQQLPNVIKATRFDQAMKSDVNDVLKQASQVPYMQANTQPQNMTVTAPGGQPQTATPVGQPQQQVSQAPSAQQAQPPQQPAERDLYGAAPGTSRPSVDNSLAGDVGRALTGQKLPTQDQDNQKGWAAAKSAARSRIVNEIGNLQYQLRQGLNRLDNGQYEDKTLTSSDARTNKQSTDVKQPSGVLWGSTATQPHQPTQPHAIPGGESKSGSETASHTSNQRLQQGNQLQNPEQFYGVRNDMTNAANDQINKRKQMLEHIDQNAVDAKGQPLVVFGKKGGATGNTHDDYEYRYNPASEAGMKFHQGLSAPWQSSIGAAKGNASPEVTQRTHEHDTYLQAAKVPKDERSPTQQEIVDAYEEQAAKHLRGGGGEQRRPKQEQPGVIQRMFGGGGGNGGGLPPKAQLQQGQTYNTGRGPATWDGEKFIPTGR